MTKYEVLERIDASDGVRRWVECGEYEAHSPEHAIRQHCEKHGEADGTYVAPPIRSWQPLTLVTERVAKTRLVMPSEPVEETEAEPEGAAV